MYSSAPFTANEDLNRLRAEFQQKLDADGALRRVLKTLEARPVAARSLRRARRIASEMAGSKARELRVRWLLRSRRPIR